MHDNAGIPVEDRPVCPLCGGMGRVLYRDLRDRFFGAPGLWSFLECPACGHVWLSPAPPPEELWRLYTRYFPRTEGEGVPSQPSVFGDHATRGLYAAVGYPDATHDRRERVLGRLLYYLPNVRESIESRIRYLHGPPVGRFLDVGSGSGGYLRFMRSLGWDVQGLEPYSAENEPGDLSVIHEPVDRADLPANTYDVITLHHVIEHLSDPVLALRNCARAARPHGLVLLRTPNWDSLGRHTYGQAWMHLDPPRHLHLFSPKGLREVVVRAGLRVESVRTVSMGAATVAKASRSIQATGQHDFSLPSSPDWASRRFGWRETAMRLVQPEVGEQIVLLARKSAT